MPLNFSYGEIVAMLQGLSDSRSSVTTTGCIALAPFVLQDPPRLEEIMNTRPDGGGRPPAEATRCGPDGRAAPEPERRTMPRWPGSGRRRPQYGRTRAWT